MIKMYCNICNKYRKFKNSKIYLKEKHQVFLLLTVSVLMNIKKDLKKKILMKY